MTITVPIWLVWILAPLILIALGALSFFAWVGVQFAKMFNGRIW